MVKLVWTTESQLWLKEIHDYIKLDSPNAAKKTVRSIRQKAQIVKNHPRAGYLYDHNFGDYEIRILLYGHYRIAHLLGKSDIYVLGVFHGSLDIKKHLRIPDDLK